MLQVSAVHLQACTKTLATCQLQVAQAGRVTLAANAKCGVVCVMHPRLVGYTRTRWWTTLQILQSTSGLFAGQRSGEMNAGDRRYLLEKSHIVACPGVLRRCRVEFSEEVREHS